MRIYKGKFYYEFQHLIPKLISKQNGKCFVCGEEKNLEPHHLKKVKPGNSKYSDENNVIILCRKCHNKYHQKYNKKQNGGINPKTFMIFKRDQDNKKISKLVSERNMFKNSLKKTENKLELLQQENEKLNNGLFDESDYKSFVELYNDYTISVDEIIRRIGNPNYRLYRRVALDSGDIVQRPRGLRFGY